MDVNYFDIVAILILLFFTLRGAFNGAIAELTGLIATIAGLYCASVYASSFSLYLQDYLPEQWLVPATFVLIFFVVVIICSLLGKILESLFEAFSLTFLDKLLGLALGLAKAIIICFMLTYIASMFFAQEDFVTHSTLIPYFKSGILWLLDIFPADIQDVIKI